MLDATGGVFTQRRSARMHERIVAKNLPSHAARSIVAQGQPARARHYSWESDEPRRDALDIALQCRSSHTATVANSPEQRARASWQTSNAAHSRYSVSRKHIDRNI